MAKELVVWIDPDGNQLPLDGSTGVKLLLGRSGWDMPPISFVESEVPQEFGSRLKEVVISPRELDIPILLKADTPEQLLALTRSVRYAFSPIRGQGTLRATEIDGSQREISGRYLQGLELADDDSVKGQTWQKAMIVVKAFYPFWLDTATQVFTFQSGQSSSTFFPIFPLRLSNSTVFATPTVNNSGEVDACPEWIITGPGSQITLKNITTGKSINLPITLNSGETVRINTAPGVKTVMKNGASIFGQMVGTMWWLKTGENSLQLEMSGTTSESSIQLSFKNGYLGV